MKIRALQLVGHKNTRPAALCVGTVPSLFGPSGADRRKVQDGCQNGQLWLGVPLRESREMLFGENAIRRPQFAKPCLMDLLCISP
mgnify:CR=1 FL=1